MKPNARYLSLDVWRGLACLMVVIDHVGLILSQSEIDAPGAEGFLRMLAVGSVRAALGPPMFFVISGYCIASSLESLLSKGKSSAEFLKRRLVRTLPPYWAAMALFALLPVYLNHIGQSWLAESPYGIRLLTPDSLSLWQWVGNITLTEGFRPLFVGPETTRLIPVTWTLGLQEQFYLICFAAALISPKRFRAALATTTALIIAFQCGVNDIGAGHRVRGLFTEYWHEFAVGLGVYWRLNTKADRKFTRAFDLLLIAAAAASIRAGHDSTAKAAGFGLLLIGLRPVDAKLATAALLEPIRACGRRSYSIYLAHIPVLVMGTSLMYEWGWVDFGQRVLVVIPTVSAACVAGGFVFYEMIESRFNGSTKRSPLARPGRRSFWPSLSDQRLQGCS